MKRDFNPVDVELSIENPSIERGAFYRLCFITESNIAPRTLKVTRLQDLLDNGYSRLDLAYNFCVGVFSQQGIDTVYIRAKRSYESYVEAYNSDDNSMYYFVVLQTKDLTEIKKFNSHLVSSDEMKLQFFSQNVGSKILKSPKLVNYYQDYTLSGGVPVESKDYYLNKAYSGVTVVSKIPLPDYLLAGYGNTAVDYGVRMMAGKDYIWEIDKPNRQVKYARKVVESGWVGSREDSTINNSEVTVVATKGRSGKLLRAIIKDPKVKIETISRELLKGLGKEVLDYAIPLIDPEAAGWVLDPDSNQITIGVDSGMLSITAPRYKVTGSTPNEVCEDFVSTHNSLNTSTAFWGEYRFVGSTPESCILRFNGLRGLPENEWGDAIRDFDSPASKKIPIDTVAAQVIANAEAGHAPSQEALRLATVERVATGEYDEALEAASTEIDTSWKYLPIFDVAVQVKRNSIAGHAESIEAVNNSLPFELPDNDTPWSYVPEQTSVIGSTTTVKAKRTFKNQKLKSTISVTASASKVGESLIKGGGSDALAYTVPQLIGDGVDWVLDPANNAIKYKDNAGTGTGAGAASASSCASLASAGGVQPYLDSNGWTTYYCSNVYVNSQNRECRVITATGGRPDMVLGEYCAAPPVAGGGGTAPSEYKSIPMDTVAAKVIANAEAGHAPSQEAVKAVALEGFAAGEHDAALDAAATKDN